MRGLSWRTGRLAGLFVWACVLAGPAAPARAYEAVHPLARFEGRFPVASDEAPGFRARDARNAAVLSGGARGSKKFARFFFTPQERAAFFQYRVRRRYLATGSGRYVPNTANCLSFWLRVPAGSHLVSDRAAKTLGVWSYHWSPGDRWVGGSNNRSGTTDSMMHGYANLRLLPGAAGRWIHVELSASAFRHQRDYYHFFAAEAVTDGLEFFPSLRQLQWVVLGGFDSVEAVDLDEVELLRKPPTGRFEPAFVETEASASRGELRIPVSLRNPTDRRRRYRVFASSELGAPRKLLNQAFAEADSIRAPTEVQEAVGAGGGLGAVELYSTDGTPILASGTELEIPPGKVWRGYVVHRIRREMLGRWVEASLGGRRWYACRNTLTSSVIAWDVTEPPGPGAAYVRAAPSNADDGAHRAPPGFPRQLRPPPGWRSEDVPADQVGAYFVSVVTLKP